MFSTEANLNLLEKTRVIFSDGTFAAVPTKLFHQLYSIHGVILGAVMPLVFALLPNKTQATYNRLLEKIKEYKWENEL